MDRASFGHLVERDEFRPFKIITSAGIAYEITDPGSLALGQRALFYFFPRTDRSIHIPYSQIATIEEPPVPVKRK